MANHTPSTPYKAPLCRGRVQQRFPTADPSQVDALALVWDEVVQRITSRVMDLAVKDQRPLHINIRAEMVHELAKVQLWLSERVIDKRTAGRQLEEINVERELEECLGSEGEENINRTARVVFDRIWSRKMDERWVPKSARAIERDDQPPKQTALPVKPVTKNHFIPRWFIRDHWAVDGMVMRWRRTGEDWASSLRPFGQWGYGHKLYSDQLEAYFSLLEGDAKQPVESLLATVPINDPQRKALVAFMVIQLIRNPRFIKAIVRGMAPIVAEMGHADDPEMPVKAYESLFENNDFYDQLARPLMWSRWAIVKSNEPVFVLPDRFAVARVTADGLRMLVPLTPNACFVTLPKRESEKRVVPWSVTTDAELAQSISATLVSTALQEFISHPSFDPIFREPIAFEELLDAVEAAVQRSSDDCA